MEKLENLSQYKKIALEGEIAFACSTSTSDSELLARLYIILKKEKAETTPYIVELIRDMYEGEQSRIDRVILEVCNKTFPKWLWLEKTITDIKLSLTVGEQESSMRVRIDRREAKKKIIKSSFVSFCRILSEISEHLLIDLCSAVSEEIDLTFLHDICFVLRNEAYQSLAEKGIEDSEAALDDDLLHLEFDPKDLLSYYQEIDRLNKGKKKESLRDALLKHSKEDKVIAETLNRIDNLVQALKGEFEDSKEEQKEKIKEVLNKGISKYYEESPKNKEGSAKVQYLVEKEFLGTDIKTVLKVFDSEKDAHKFVEKITEQFPEILNTCKYTVIEKRVK